MDKTALQRRLIQQTIEAE